MAARILGPEELCALCTPPERTHFAQRRHRPPAQDGHEMDGAVGVINGIALSAAFWSVVLLWWFA